MVKGEENEEEEYNMGRKVMGRERSRTWITMTLFFFKRERKEKSGKGGGCKELNDVGGIRTKHSK